MASSMLNFRRRMIYPKVFVETGMPQVQRNIRRFDTEELKYIWDKARLSHGSRNIQSETSSYIIYHGFNIDDAHMFIGVKKVDSPSYRDIFFVGVFDYLVLPGLDNAIYFYHLEKLESVQGFSVVNFMLSLLSEGSLVSDEGQTAKGIALWKRLVAEANARDYTVALFNTVDSSYIDISGRVGYVERNASKIWGHGEQFRRVRLLLTNESLPKDKTNEHE